MDLIVLATDPSLVAYNLIDKELTRESQERLGEDTDWWYDRANRAEIKAGFDPTVVEVLITRSVLEDISPTKRDIAFRITDPNTTGYLSIEQLLFTGAEAIDPDFDPAQLTADQDEYKTLIGDATFTGYPRYVNLPDPDEDPPIIGAKDLTIDANQVLLATFKDHRCLFHRASAATLAYNVISSSTFGETESRTYYDATKNPSTSSAWTWAEILQDLWSLLPTTLTLDLTNLDPVLTPANLVGKGMTVWEMFQRILDAQGHTLFPTASGFSVAPFGAASTLEAAIIAAAKVQNSTPLLIDTTNEMDPDHLPAEVMVTAPAGEASTIIIDNDEIDTQYDIGTDKWRHYTVDTTAEEYSFSPDGLAAGAQDDWNEAYFSVAQDMLILPIPVSSTNATTDLQDSFTTLAVRHVEYLAAHRDAYTMLFRSTMPSWLTDQNHSRIVIEDTGSDREVTYFIGPPPRPVFPIPSGSGSGGTSESNRARVYTDLAGYQYDDEPRATIPTASVIRLTRDGSQVYIDPAASVEDAEVDFDAALVMSDSGCCGNESATVTGAVITYPTNGDQRVDGANAPDGDEGSLLIQGTNVQKTSTVTVSIHIPGENPDPEEQAIVNADGSWNVTFDLTGLGTATTGPLIVRVTETLIGTPAETLPVVYAILTWAKGYNGSAMGDIDDTPTLAPILNSVSNTGDTDDLVTSDRFPIFTIGSTRTSTASGPGWKLYANGVEVASYGAPDDSAFVGLRTTAQVTNELQDGRYRITYTLTTDYGGGAVVESGHSPPLDIVIDGSADDASDQIWATIFADGDFDTGDATIPLTGTFTLKNLSELADPSAPTSVDQPEQRLVGQDGDKIQLQRVDGAWKVVSRDLGIRRFARDCHLGTMNGVLTITNVSSCPREITPQEAIILDRP